MTFCSTTSGNGYLTTFEAPRALRSRQRFTLVGCSKIRSEGVYKLKVTTSELQRVDTVCRARDGKASSER
eukprot:3485004-Prymnesium_polylepis.1